MSYDIERFRERYTMSGEAALMAVEKESLGSDFQANGYTTRVQADEIGVALDLRPGQLLLDLGAGCGWPGLYLAEKYGCALISLDPVVEGARAAHRRTAADGMSDRSWPVLASADAIPFRPQSVDAIVHADVLC